MRWSRHVSEAAMRDGSIAEAAPSGPTAKGVRVYARRGSKIKPGQLTGGSRICQLEDCGGRRLATRWPDGTLTWPCTKGMTFSEKRNAWRIG